MKNLVFLKKKVVEIIKKSLVPEDLPHSKNTLKWLLKLKPNADEALKITALSHDIERAIKERKIKRGDYKSFEKFKDAHALNSANIMKEIMQDCNMSKELINDVYYLVRHHEKGGNNRVDVLKDADTISFFDVNLQYYFKRNNIQETKNRLIWGYNRLSNKLKRIVTEFSYQDKKLKSLVRTCFLDNNSKKKKKKIYFSKEL